MAASRTSCATRCAAIADRALSHRRELLALAAQHVLGGAIVGHGCWVTARVFGPGRNDIPTVLLALI
jgi:hypothetical protein